jgi:CubicO group peptidase (beta-lactamase class C family)
MGCVMRSIHACAASRWVDISLGWIMDEKLKTIESAVQHIVTAFELPGLTISITQHGEIIYTQAFGVKNILTQEPMTTDSLFHLASISKLFVCTGIMQLVERVKIDLSAPLVTYLPYFKLDDERYTRITIGQMLSHISGMPDVEDYDWEHPEYDDGALERFVRSVSGRKMLFNPGEKFTYSNMAFEILGDVIAKVSGLSFEDYEEEHILRPLGMKDSTFLRQRVNRTLATSPHLQTPHPLLSAVYPYHRAHAPSSTLHSNVFDLARWGMANLNRGELDGARILQSSTYDLLWQPVMRRGEDEPATHVGLSWFLSSYQGVRTFSHSGGDVGYNSHFTILPDHDLTVSVLVNSIPTPVVEIAQVALAHLLDLKVEMPRLPALLPVNQVLEKDGAAAAEAAFRSLRQGNPEGYAYDEGQFMDCAFALESAGKAQEGIEMLKLGLNLFPDSAALYFYLGLGFSKIGDLPQAVKYLRRFLELRPDSRMGQELLERVLKG